MKSRLIIAGVILMGIVVSIIIFTIARPYIPRPVSAGVNVQLVEVAADLEYPLYVTHAGDGTGRLFVVEQGGRIRIMQDGQVLETPFLDISSLVSRDSSERGLLGLAFHPQYAENGRFFIDYTDVNGNTVVASYVVSKSNANQADFDSGTIMLRVEQPFPNHNAGQLTFGPDGYIYIGLGDGGSAGDPNGNGQNTAVLLGKMLRLDVDHGTPYSIPPDNPFAHNSAFAPEIWATGLRNPWRYSFDRATGDLYIADVGQNEWEEVNFQPASSKGGENYGWNAFESTHRFSEITPIPEQYVMPIAEYSHADGCSISGGYVYRGQALTYLQGTYVFGDYCTGTTWMTHRDAAGDWQTSPLMNTGRVISSFGEDEQGELYLVDYGGTILRFDKPS